MNVICLEDQAFYALVEKVVERLKEKNDVTDDPWVKPDEAMQILNAKKTKMQTLRDEGKIRFSQPTRKGILYDRASLYEYLEKHAKETF